MISNVSHFGATQFDASDHTYCIKGRGTMICVSDVINKHVFPWSEFQRIPHRRLEEGRRLGMYGFCCRVLARQMYVCTDVDTDMHDVCPFLFVIHR